MMSLTDQDITPVIHKSVPLHILQFLHLEQCGLLMQKA